MRISCVLFPMAALFSAFSLSHPQAQTPVVLVDQGPNWTEVTRADFYSRDQGSRWIPLRWLESLKRADGQSFLSDSLSRYGYLANTASSNGLPIGFNASGPAGTQVVGMTCSACHTRQINVQGTDYRIDGGPAIVDFQSLLSDLDLAVETVLGSAEAFLPFAAAVLISPSPDSQRVSSLRRDVNAWYLRYHTLISRALPKVSTSAWGPARLDAIGMIFNRVTGLDLGPPPNFLIPENIKTADAPARYPFLWNAPRQDKTQWPGFADNGSDILGLSRNLGEVLGVFGVFQPKNEGRIVDFLSNNSANFDGLSKLEELVREIGAPKWPWLIDTKLAAQGKRIYDRTASEGGCKDCHDQKSGQSRFLQPTWATPIRDVQTDTRQHDILSWNAKSGSLQGVYIPAPFPTEPLKETDSAYNILRTSVIGSILEHLFIIGGGGTLDPQAPFLPSGGQLGDQLPAALGDLQGAFNTFGVDVESPESIQPKAQEAPGQISRRAASTPLKGSYEARVLQGIWAAAPYLHNGSVPTLAELLKPASERVKSFKVGPSYDIYNIGLATYQTQFSFELVTTDCSDRNSGNSRCGHEYGTQLNVNDKAALLEYLKSL